MKAILKTFATYQLDVHIPADVLAERLPIFSDRPLAAQEANKRGFVPIAGTENTVTALANGWATAFRDDTKVVPPSALKNEIDRLTKKFRDETGHPPGRNEHKRLKGEALANLLPGALAKTSIAAIAYASSTQRLYVTGSQRLVDRAVNALINVLEAAKTTTIHVNTPRRGITPRLKAYIASEGADDLFHPFAIGSEVVMVGTDNRKWSVKHTDLHRTFDTLREAIEQGAEVDSVQLLLGDVPFRLTNKLSVAGMRHLPIPPDELHGDQTLDTKAELTLEIDTVNSVWNGLLQLLDPKAIQQQVAESKNPDAPEEEFGDLF